MSIDEISIVAAVRGKERKKERKKERRKGKGKEKCCIDGRC
jgi:hypothetical protein